MTVLFLLLLVCELNSVLMGNILRFESDSSFNAVKGEKLHMKCWIKYDIKDYPYSDQIDILLPNGLKAEPNEDMKITEFRQPVETEVVLMINKFNRSRDDGVYKCVLKDEEGNISETLNATIKFISNPILNVSSPKSVENVLLNYEGFPTRVSLSFTYEAYPAPKFSCISSSKKRTQTYLNITEREVKILVEDVEYDVSGNYTLIANNGLTKTATVELRVSGKPKLVAIQDEIWVNEEGDKVNKIVFIEAFPKANISWKFLRCYELQEWPHCYERSREDKNIFVEIKDTLIYETSLTYYYHPRHAGALTFFASNIHGSVEWTTSIKIGNIRNLEIIKLHNETWNDHTKRFEVTTGDKIELECRAPIYGRRSLFWSSNKNQLGKVKNTKYALRSILTHVVSDDDDGIFECKMLSTLLVDITISMRHVVKVVKGKRPEIAELNMTKVNDDLIELGSNVEGYPQPSVSWFKDNKLLIREDNTTGQKVIWNPKEFFETKAYLKVSNFDGLVDYSCKVKNKFGTDTKSIKVTAESFISGFIHSVFNF